MLSEMIREMRREFQDILKDTAGDAHKVEVSALQFQSYTLALAYYEDEAIKFERALNMHDEPTAPAAPADSVVVLFRDHHKKRPQLHVVSMDGSGGDIA
ncbi:hypothetical protein [Brucella pituitosa]|uniref:hypothetical protein n=1 Tax=Brucella pituitosa TaxID=571256 RepID=UPI003F4AA9D5